MKVKKKHQIFWKKSWIFFKKMRKKVFEKMKFRTKQDVLNLPNDKFFHEISWEKIYIFFISNQNHTLKTVSFKIHYHVKIQWIVSKLNRNSMNFSSCFPWQHWEIEFCKHLFHRRIFIKKGSNFHWKNVIFSNSNSRRYTPKNIKIMRKTWIFVKGYPFDSLQNGSKNFHNHKINWIKSTNSQKVYFSKTIFRVKWDVSFKLWWKICEKKNFKISFPWNFTHFLF